MVMGSIDVIWSFFLHRNWACNVPCMSVQVSSKSPVEPAEKWTKSAELHCSCLDNKFVISLFLLLLNFRSQCEHVAGIQQHLSTNLLVAWLSLNSSVMVV
ncbi:hypothetical protein Dsin_027665 [Dipteronia sinensis]|uniref:SWIM-type domain-containing protein n=1 Tax=Dipteronia sinensis TaxID=43782 RepID=A0AAD9ZPB8_9ROSI|nr:hypothetical protein Dsin_027665 [Dipteronia sinensis]